MIQSLTLLSLSCSMAFAWGIGNRNPGYPVYGGHSQLQPAITSTVTTTQISTIMVGGVSCDAVHMPTMTTVYVECPSASAISSFLGVPTGSLSSHGPWLDATSTPSLPCTHGPISTGLSPGNISSSVTLGWNSSMFTSQPTLTGTAGTTIETAKPVNTSSFPWANSTATSMTEFDSTVVVTVTLTSSAVATVGVSVTSVQPIDVPSSSGRIGTIPPGNISTTVSTPYQPSMTYKTTSSALPSVTSATLSNSTSSATPVSSVDNITTTATNEPLDTTTTGPTSVAPVGPSTNTWSDTTLVSPSPSPTSGAGDDNNGGEYGGYTYSFASSTTPSSVSTSSIISDISSVDAIGATTTTASTSTSGSAITDSTLDHPTATSTSTSTNTTFITSVMSGTVTSSLPWTLITITTQAATSTSSSLAGGGYGDAYGYGGY